MVSLSTVEILNSCFHHVSDNLIDYLVYVHNNGHNTFEGFYFLRVNCLTGHMTLFDCLCHCKGPLWVCTSIQLCIFYMNEQLVVQRKMEAKKVYSNFMQDCFTMERYSVSYECHMNSVLDQIIAFQDDKCNGSDMIDSSTDN